MRIFCFPSRDSGRTKESPADAFFSAPPELMAGSMEEPVPCACPERVSTAGAVEETRGMERQRARPAKSDSVSEGFKVRDTRGLAVPPGTCRALRVLCRGFSAGRGAAEGLQRLHVGAGQPQEPR